MSIHKNYLKLNDDEKEFVDHIFRYAFDNARNTLWHAKIPLDGDDKAERAVEAFATWVVESRER